MSMLPKDGSTRTPIRRRAALAAIVTSLSILATAIPFGDSPALAVGTIIVVNTTSDLEFPGAGLCSLRAAILASNVGGFAGDCDTAGTAGQDSIRFDIGSGVPVIAIGSELPAIVQPVIIRGNTFGATHVRLAGPRNSSACGAGCGTGLRIAAGAAGTTIRGLRIDGFTDGIWSLAANVTIAGNWIGPNARDGVSADGANATIGGINTLDPTGPCSGDCNLIRGNANRGLYLNSSGTVSGNFIGIDASGRVATAATANGTGIVVTQGDWTIGGTTSGQGNVVSGNTGRGMWLYNCSCTVQGNRIGTNLAGGAKVPNGSDGIHTNGHGSTIGGLADGAGNLISGNGDDGIEFSDKSAATSTLRVYGNRIGTTANGSPLGNGSAGIRVGGSDAVSVQEGIIGAPGLAGAANVIAHNKGPGVFVGQHARFIRVRGNSIHDNDVHYKQGILVVAPANESVAAPTIATGLPIHGSACSGCIVDVYSDPADEGRTYEGAVTADGSGDWTFVGSPHGPKVTATATTAGNSTSMFSSPRDLPAAKRPDGRIRRGTGVLVGDDIYNVTGIGQTRSATASPGGTVTFGVSIQNDGPSDRFRVSVMGSATKGYAVTYLRGTTDITAAVIAGTYTSPVLAADGTFLITIRIKVRSSAAVGSLVSRSLTVTSVGDPAKQDTVRCLVRRI